MTNDTTSYWLKEVAADIDIRVKLSKFIEDNLKKPDMSPSLLARLIVKDFKVSERL